MPGMIKLMLTRLATGFAIGCSVGFVVWQNGFVVPGTIENYIAQALFIYLFASTISIGYLATALLLEE
ncbi:hypothetical protein [Rhizobium etli]|uniref:hypothetical protein n=1 Tax=Rhizobium etli TaxID=29449 RepID=UPI000383A73E|nr:hypothetical protein [Rhizobium etli]AGS25596.1 hypothetical protein REMIM1_PE00510 [Rhizobium etli bv. mimosae str. Mim1]